MPVAVYNSHLREDGLLLLTTPNRFDVHALEHLIACLRRFRRSLLPGIVAAARPTDVADGAPASRAAAQASG